jgi:hypothetical protein
MSLSVLSAPTRRTRRSWGEVQFYIGDDYVSVTKSCLVYIPRGIAHSPILVPRLDRPIIHFSGGNGGDYKREGSDQFLILEV